MFINYKNKRIRNRNDKEYCFIFVIGSIDLKIYECMGKNFIYFIKWGLFLVSKYKK